MPYPLVEEIQQVIAPDGEVVGDLPDVTNDQHLSFYRWMLLGRVFSDRMVALQRQGRMGTFAPHSGQEASAAIATALEPDDWLMGSYREMIAYMTKGTPMLTLMEMSRGDLPNHTRDAHCLPVQIVLATQMLHAAGIAMGLKYDGKPNVSVGVCGDGATSEGDFNETLNFAGVYQLPLVVVVQNNGWAISTPRNRQSAAQHIAHRAPGFGLPGYLVDGNDILAIHKVMAECVARARAGEGPSLVELLTYRMGAHTTADDPTRYQPDDEVSTWKQRGPINRYRTFLMTREILTNEADELMHDSVTAEVQETVEALEALPPQDPGKLFDRVYETRSPQLEKQYTEILQGGQHA
ncbi:MAG: thiamine pyrophosphate-dependent dehydrogenase E1 component subunit alpha [Chloroflexota bacterium]